MQLGAAAMVSHRPPVGDEDDLLIEAVREVAAAVGPIVAELAAARARFLTAQQIEERRLVPLESVTDQPTAFELLVAILRALEAHAGRPRATATGAHAIAKKVGVSMGVYGSERQPGFRRTRGQIEADKDARWASEQAIPVATRSAAQGRQQ